VAIKQHDRPEEKRTERRHVPGIVMPFLVRELFSVLTPTEWKLWCCLYLHSNRDGVCCLKNETLIAEIGVGKNAFHEAKRGLIDRKWLENLGQRNKRGANIYRVLIGVPKSIQAFIDALWDRLGEEDFWNRCDSGEAFDYSDNQFEWLVESRVIRVLKATDPTWKPNMEISPALASKAQQSLLEKLRRAGSSMGHGKGMWFLWGDGLDAQEIGFPKIGNPESNSPGFPKIGDLGLPKSNNPA
jgi:hypothetical protein